MFSCGCGLWGDGEDEDRAPPCPQAAKEGKRAKRPSETHRRITHSRAQSKGDRTYRTLDALASCTHGIRTDRSIGRTSIHRAATATASARESDCAGAPPYDVRPRCTTRRACRYLLIGTGGGQTGGARWWSGSEAARRNDATVRFFSLAPAAWRWLGACRGGGRAGRPPHGVHHGGRAGAEVEWESERCGSAARGKDKEE